MKRKIAWLLMIALLMLTLPLTSLAAEQGEMLIVSDPIEGAVGDIVKVNFYCYPNLSDGRLLDSLSGSMKYDKSVLTLGSVSQADEETNLVSLMKGKASNFIYNVEDPGIMQFAFIDAYGVDGDGFWFQAEFRIEKEGATDFIFNGITYTGLLETLNDDGTYSYQSESYTIEPVSVGGVYTTGESVPTDGAVDETFAPLDPAVETVAPVTPTPKPSNGGQTVPVTTTLPTPANMPTASSGTPTQKPPVTSVPVRTPAPQNTQPAATNGASAAPATEPAATENAPVATDTEPVATEPGTEDPTVTQEATNEPVPVAEVTPDGKDLPVETQTAEPGTEPVEPTQPQQPSRALVIAIIAGIVVVILLAILAIVLILIRNRRMNQED